MSSTNGQPTMVDIRALSQRLDGFEDTLARLQGPIQKTLEDMRVAMRGSLDGSVEGLGPELQRISARCESIETLYLSLQKNVEDLRAYVVKIEEQQRTITNNCHACKSGMDLALQKQQLELTGHQDALDSIAEQKKDTKRDWRGLWIALAGAGFGGICWFVYRLVELVMHGTGGVGGP